MVRVLTILKDQNALSELGKEHTIPLLEVLFMRGWLIASEVARELSIHISTAQSYLESLKEKNIVKSRNRTGRANLVEYSLQHPTIQVNIDLKDIITKKGKEAKEKARHFFIREIAGAKVSYEWDEEKRKILAINFMEKSKKFGRLNISRSIELTDIEGKFLWFLPQATEKPKNVLSITKEAGLNQNYDLIKIIELVELLSNEKIIIIYKKEEG